MSDRYSFEVYGSDGAAAIQRNGQDILHVIDVAESTTASGHEIGDEAHAGWRDMTDDEHTALLVLIAHAIDPGAVAEDELERARDIIHGD